MAQDSVSPLLLPVAASLLACGPRQASGQLFISPDSLTAVERHRNVLALENVPEGVQEYSWYRGAEDSAETMIISFRPPDSKVPGPLYSNLVTVTSKGYLSFRMCTLNDTGNYTVRVDTGNGTQRATGWLEVLGEWQVVPLPTADGSWTRGLYEGTPWRSCSLSVSGRHGTGSLGDGHPASPAHRAARHLQALVSLWESVTFYCCITPSHRPAA